MGGVMIIKDIEQFVIVKKTTQELWSKEVYLSSSGAKSSWYHAHKYSHYGVNQSLKGKYFNEQDIYEIVKVKLVRVDD